MAVSETKLNRMRNWYNTQGKNSKHLVSKFKKAFNLDMRGAAIYLYKIGAIDEKFRDGLLKGEETRLEKKRLKKQEKEYYYEEYDGYFAYIAGYTSGGAPYGLTWEELGIDTSLPIEERLKKLAEL